MKLYNVPFVHNPNDKCTPATVEMIIRYFLPASSLSSKDIEKLYGYAPGKGTWSALFMVNLAKLDLEVYWIEDFDHESFINAPEPYLQTILEPEAFAWQKANSDLTLEARRLHKYSQQHLPFEHRPATQQDIISFLDDGWLVRLEVNSKTLAHASGCEGHSILAIGYDTKGIIAHNPDGTHGNQPSQHINWDQLQKAWGEFGNTYSLYAFRGRRESLNL